MTIGSSRLLVSLSIVSHAHGEQVRDLVRDLDRHCSTPLEILLTGNRPEDKDFASPSSSHKICVHLNHEERGFAVNQNAAFERSSGDYFCVLNPDVRIRSDPFPALLRCLEDPDVGVAAPIVLDSDGAVQQSFRDVMSPWMLARRAFGQDRRPGPIEKAHIYPEWVAGMFMLFRREVFSALSGFDERYFLYCEDMELCCRLWLAGLKVKVCPSALVVHDGQYASRNKARHLALHLVSLAKFWQSRSYTEFRKRFPKHQS